MNQKILVNPEVLSQSYAPEKVLQRGKELSQLISNIKNSMPEQIEKLRDDILPLSEEICEKGKKFSEELKDLIKHPKLRGKRKYCP